MGLSSFPKAKLLFCRDFTAADMSRGKAKTISGNKLYLISKLCGKEKGKQVVKKSSRYFENSLKANVDDSFSK